MIRDAWDEIEDIIFEPLPECIKKILSICGYDSMLGISEIDENAVTEVEQYVNNNRNIIRGLECCFANTYKKLEKFRFLPGHRILILHLSNRINETFESKKSGNSNDFVVSKQSVIESGSADRGTDKYSFLLNLLIDSAEQNCGVPKNRYRYDEVLQLFSTYVFLSSGRSCYELLSSNLSIPSKYTICELVLCTHFSNTQIKHLVISFLQ